MQISKNAFPPKGAWQFFQPQTNWNAPANASFSVVVSAIQKMRLQNPGKGLATNLDDIEQELLDYTRSRVNAILPGFYDAVPVQAKKKQTGFRGVVNRARDRVARLAGGVETLVEWIGSGDPVASGVAAMRAGTCAVCPMNQDGGAVAIVTKPIANAIRSQMALKHELNLTTDVDSKLNTCMACDCQLKLKVWVPIGSILERTSDDTLTRFHQDCWIPAEKKRLGY